MKIRIISSLVGIAIALAVFFISEIYPFVLYLVVSIATAIILSEVLLAKGLFKKYKISVPTMLFGIFTPMLSVTTLKFIPIYLFAIVIFAVMIFFHEEFKFSEIAFVFTTSIVIVFGMSCMVLACNYIGGGEHPSFYAVITLAIPWMSDGGAYFTGTFFGKHKLCPKISPKKTVEGAIGGVIAGIIGAVLVGLVYDDLLYQNINVNYTLLFIVGVVNSVIAILGDLSFSIIKRSCHIKDYGTILPGHGGLLDRFDSVVFTAPLIFILGLYVPFIT